MMAAKRFSVAAREESCCLEMMQPIVVVWRRIVRIGEANLD
jgi:hypothetical protein